MKQLLARLRNLWLKSLRLRSVNWFALAGGVLTLVLAFASFFMPWWQITVGQTLATVRFSPASLSPTIIGYDMGIPMIAVMTWIIIMLLILAGVTLVIYSVFTMKPYSKSLLCFAYKKPVQTLVGFVLLMLLLTNIGTILGIFWGPSMSTGMDLNLPWNGYKMIKLPDSFAQGMVAGISVSAQVGWTFWLAVADAGLSICARVYHRKIEHLSHLDVEKVLTILEVNRPLVANA